MYHKDFQRIPGVGKSIARDLWDLGYRSTSDLRCQDPEDMYARLCLIRGGRLDRCLLYVFRCAVYFASETAHDPDLLKWWNWKD
ncbi:MAG: pathogenicity locus [Peptococcaceae bacterium]|nr:MAG: pathogenicity locus [Peptococcaceae bacterium]